MTKHIMTVRVSMTEKSVWRNEKGYWNGYVSTGLHLMHYVPHFSVTQFDILRF